VWPEEAVQLTGTWDLFDQQWLVLCGEPLCLPAYERCHFESITLQDDRDGFQRESEGSGVDHCRVRSPIDSTEMRVTDDHEFGFREEGFGECTCK